MGINPFLQKKITGYPRFVVMIKLSKIKLNSVNVIKNCILLYFITNNHKLSFIVFLKDFSANFLYISKANYFYSCTKNIFMIA